MKILNNEQITMISGGVTMEVNEGGGYTVHIGTDEEEFYFVDHSSRGSPAFIFKNGVIGTATTAYSGASAQIANLAIARENTVDGTTLTITRS